MNHLSFACPYQSVNISLSKSALAVLDSHLNMSLRRIACIRGHHHTTANAILCFPLKRLFNQLWEKKSVILAIYIAGAQSNSGQASCAIGRQYQALALNLPMYCSSHHGKNSLEELNIAMKTNKRQQHRAAQGRRSASVTTLLVLHRNAPKLDAIHKGGSMPGKLQWHST